MKMLMLCNFYLFIFFFIVQDDYVIGTLLEGRGCTEIGIGYEVI